MKQNVKKKKDKVLINLSAERVILYIYCEFRSLNFAVKKDRIAAAIQAS